LHPVHLFDIIRAMHSGTRIALVGDFNETQKAHQAIPRALAAVPDASAEGVWVPTDSIANGNTLSEFDGIWCVPGMPYRNADGALRAIRRARESRIPFLGTSAGFQYALIEHARNVLGMADADHQKTNPKAATPLISPLGCALLGVKARVRLTPGSAIRKAYGVPEMTALYHCSFGLNGRYRRFIESSSLHVAAVDDQDEIRAVEMDGHPFFAATLFQPEMEAPSAFVNAFVAACARQKGRLTKVAS
jgi:CTP synthase (UTP-ammonia lyase)